MAVAVLIEVPGGTREQYEAVLEKLGLAGKNAGWPAGALVHLAGPTEGGWRTVDVWESREAFEQFERERLQPAAAEVGIPPVELEFFPVHNLYRG